MRHPLLTSLFVLGLLAGALPGSAPMLLPAAPAPAPAQESASGRSLTICLGYEPESLYLYSAQSQAAREVLQAIYDGPFDERDGEVIPVILTDTPDFSYAQVNVSTGQSVVDSRGQAVRLQAGTRVFPSGCRSADCAIEWDGSSPLQLDQPSLRFTLLPDLKWSDGEALTAADSVYSYSLASDPATPGDKIFVEQTINYVALDERTVAWSGLPGLVSDRPQDYFWSPLPRHAWGELSATDLLTADAANRSPLGWGPYVMDEWQSGAYIRLKKNPDYFRADEGLPRFDTLTFKITDTHGDTNLANLKFDREPFAQFKYDLGAYGEEVEHNGCDLVSTTVDMRDQLEVLNILLNYFSDAGVQVTHGSESEAAWLLFNRRTEADVSAALFDDLDMRQAAAACLERGELVDTVFHNLAQVPGAIALQSTVPAGAANPQLAPDPAKGQALLEAAGWLAGEPRVDEDGRPLSVNFLTLNDTLNLAAAQSVKASLTECGFQVNIIAVAPQVFWDRQNKESIFAGNFDLAQVNWPLPLANPCPLFSGKAGEGASLNFAAYDNAELDALCAQWEATPLSGEKEALVAQMESLLNEDLALVPLYVYSNLRVARVDFCPVQADDLNDLAGIESFDFGGACAP
ncbi:MAG: peptide/nickel transport system substrate-binding protein [Chloroflexota bacterium]|nr:peptide/nickel transport system substrate-binding protein [Chloroflexota bacterium]